MSVDRLRELLEVCESGQLAELGRWLSPRLSHYIENARHGVSLDQALDLTAAPGEAPWFQREALQARDAAIRTIAEYLPETSTNAQAEAIAKLARRYVTSSWKHEKDGELPEHYRNTKKEPLFRALRAWPRFPGVRQLREIIGN